MIECRYLNECQTGLKDRSKCKKCANNHKRNYIEDLFVEAKDNPIPEKCPRLTYDGPAEQTAGFKCPVCGEYTNPYAMRNKLCNGCGYKLNVQVGGKG